ncbi:MAG: DUF5106 domain-containing protein [Bacteroidales bacterium]
MKTSRIAFLCLAFFSLINILPAQQQSRIVIDVEGMNDSIAYIGSYWGEKMRIMDTARMRASVYPFSNDSLLPEGVYFLINSQKKRLFEFIVPNEQQFTIKTDTSNYIKNCKVAGSPANTLFFDYQHYSGRLYDQTNALNRKLKNCEPGTTADSLKHEISVLNEKNIEYKEKFIRKHPNHILSLIFNMLKETELPDSLNPENSGNEKKAYYYARKHYWDHTDLSDPRILRTPVFYNKLKTYFNQIVPKHPDSIITEIDHIMDRCEGNTELYNYLLFDLTATYEQSQIMGYDKIFVHMVDRYFRNREVQGISPAVQNAITEKADKIRPLLLDATAPELILIDTAGNFVSLYESRHDYTLILFWTTTCGECRTELKALKQWYEKTPLDIEVFSVNTDTSLNAWKNFISDHDHPWINVNGTRSVSQDYHTLYDIYKIPTSYLLNDDMKIIAKHLSIDQIIGFLQRNKNNPQP